MSVDPAAGALLADARATAERMLAQAQQQAQERVGEAERTAAAMIARAREQGEADGRLEAAHEQAREGILARGDVLRAQREAYDELRRRCRAQVLALREEAGYAALLERLAASARAQLGPGAELEIDPPDAGGVRARAGSRRLDLTLVALADDCVRELGPALRGLWA